MDYELVACRSCGLENSPGLPFCQNCGDTLIPGTEKGFADGGGSFLELAETGTRSVLENIAIRRGYDATATDDGWCITVPLPENRKQKVSVVFNGHDEEGRDLIGFLSICAPWNPRAAERLLRLNARLHYGSCALRDIEGKPMVVICANQPAATADPEELEAIMDEVARWADKVEAVLTGGGDTY